MGTVPLRVERNSEGLWLVHRQRLLDRLDEATQRPVTLLIAPCGSGKRTLLDQWVATRRDRVCRLDAARLTPQEARRALGMRQDVPRMIVVENTERADPATLDALLDLLERNTRLILSGISRPPMSLGALSARGLVSELCTPDISFTRDEARALLETVGPVPDHALDIVMATSLGWAAPLRILAEQELSWEREASQLERLRGFFTDQIYPLATDDELALLRAVSVLPRLTPAAARALTGDREAHLALLALTRRGFPLIQVGTTLTVHPLIRRDLVAELALTDPERHRDLARAGVDWLVDTGQPLAAMRLALDTDTAIEVGALLRRHFARFLYAEPQSLRGIVDACATTHRIEPWEAAAMKSAILATDGTLASDIALEAVNALAPADPSPVDRLRLAGFQLLLARQTAYRGVDVAAALAVADETTDGPPPVGEALPHLAVLQVERGMHHLHHGLLDDAHAWLLRGLTTARLADLPAAAVQALAGCAWVSARRGSVRATRRLADEALLELATVTEDPACPLADLAHLAKAMVATDLGELDEAERSLAAVRHHQHTGGRDTAVLLHQIEALGMVMANDPAGANVIIETARSELAPLLPIEEFMLACTHCGSLLVTDHDRAATEAALDLTDSVARAEFGSHEHLRAHHLLRIDRAEEAFQLLDPVVRGGGGLVEKEWLQLLMAYALAADRSDRAGVAVATFAAADELASRLGLDSPRARHNLGTVERRARVQFTEAEMRLLRNLTSEESIGELAERLFISPNTVKTHLRRIYRKLAVGSRDEAIDRARVLRLL